MHKLLIANIFFGMIMLCNQAHSCELRMGFKDGGKQPLMNKAPDNSGAFAEIFSYAAKTIGCELKIERYSKLRVHKLLRLGAVDFYPGASYSAKRSQYLHFAQIGFMSAEYGLTPINIPEITSYQDVKKLNLIWLMELGGSKREIADKLGVQVDQTQNLTIEKLLRYFRTRNANFYVVDKELVDLFLLDKEPDYLEKVGLKLHVNCCGGSVPMYAGYSKKSHHFANADINEFDFSREGSVLNQTSALKQGSVFHRFSNVLMEMHQQGITQKIYTKHLHKTQ